LGHDVWRLEENILAQYLQFYEIGSEFIEEGKELKIRSGMEMDARELLAKHVYARNIHDKSIDA
jgi:hypothetical protein